MCSYDDNRVWYEGDHVEGGMAFLKKIGYNLEKVWTASAGLDSDGAPQVLVIGFNNVALLKRNGEVTADTGGRDLRALRVTDAPGLEVCTNGFEDLDTPQRRWLHRVSKADAQHLEDLWIRLRPTTHSGQQLNPLPWREDEFAYYTGRVVTEGAKCDAALGSVAEMAYMILGWDPSKVRGRSGAKLTESLALIGDHCSSTTFDRLSELYDTWYTKRNFVVHGIRLSGNDGHPSNHVYKLNIGKKGSEVRANVEDQDLEQLTSIWRAFYDLNHCAFRVAFHLGFYNSGSTNASPTEYIAQAQPSGIEDLEKRLMKK